MLKESSPSRHEDDGDFSLYLFEPVQSVNHGVVEIAFGVGGRVESAQGRVDLTRILSEVDQNLGPDVVGHNGNPVPFAHSAHKCLSGEPGLVDDLPAVVVTQNSVDVVAELYHQNGRHGCFYRSEVGDLLLDLVLVEFKVLPLQALDQVPFLVLHRDVNADLVDSYPDCGLSGRPVGFFLKRLWSLGLAEQRSRGEGNYEAEQSNTGRKDWSLHRWLILPLVRDEIDAE